MKVSVKVDTASAPRIVVTQNVESVNDVVKLARALEKRIRGVIKTFPEMRDVKVTNLLAGKE